MEQLQKRKTRIIATLGPATDSEEKIGELIARGVDIFRFNMSHGSPDWIRRTSAFVRAQSRRFGRSVGLLLDTQGPAIRTGDLANRLELHPGDIFTFTVRGDPSVDERSVSVNYDDLAQDLRVGDVVLVDNGVIQMKVLEKQGFRVRCEVVTPGVMGSRRHINLPGVRVNLPPLTKKDLQDIDLGVECQMDYFALSFVREANDVDLLRQILIARGSKAIIVAKIEDQAAVQNLPQILDAADAIMIARGDLGIECPFEELPIIQRRIVKSCLQKMKPVIVATHLLESMTQNPVPTRAEITDIANAVYEQADALMLSGETAAGRYPLECVSVLDRVIRRTERSGGAGYAAFAELTEDQQKLASAAVHLADQVRAAAICVFTRQGKLAAVVAGLRPRYSPIYALSGEEDLCGRLLLRYGTEPIPSRYPMTQEEGISLAEEELRKRGAISSGDKVILLSEVPLRGERARSVVFYQVE
ncbi:pyruvate kinase [Methylacidimicrobium cyclopophantes]|uniref:Pyruvate kinase n=2 Tax=Methylacidimicrobium cyclopophantes TaxID=1041766 RepID=A0A5E6MD13_9BACT|nr:pyruvate kinase [Methylacidimicrobium cyclopophantes]